MEGNLCDHEDHCEEVNSLQEAGLKRGVLSLSIAVPVRLGKERTYICFCDEPNEVENNRNTQYGQRGLDGVLIEVIKEENGEHQHVSE